MPWLAVAGFEGKLMDAAESLVGYYVYVLLFGGTDYVALVKDVDKHHLLNVEAVCLSVLPHAPALLVLYAAYVIVLNASEYFELADFAKHRGTRLVDPHVIDHLAHLPLSLQKAQEIVPKDDVTGAGVNARHYFVYLIPF